VQLRKILDADFRGWEWIKEPVENIPLSRVQGGGSVGGKVWGEKSGRVGGRIVHRACTGNAEGSCQFSWV